VVLLTPSDDADGLLRDALRTAQRHALGAGISARVPRLGTKVQAGYKWVSGITVSSVDGYGESLFQMDPYLHLMFRQPLPSLPWGDGRLLRIATISWPRVMSPPAAGMAELFWYQLPDISRWTQRSVSRNYGVLESCICPSINRMMRGSPAVRDDMLLNIKGFRGCASSKQWTLGCT